MDDAKKTAKLYAHHDLLKFVSHGFAVSSVAGVWMYYDADRHYKT